MRKEDLINVPTEVKDYEDKRKLDTLYRWFTSLQLFEMVRRIKQNERADKPQTKI